MFFNQMLQITNCNIRRWFMTEIKVVNFKTPTSTYGDPYQNEITTL